MSSASHLHFVMYRSFTLHTSPNEGLYVTRMHTRTTLSTSPSSTSKHLIVLVEPIAYPPVFEFRPITLYDAAVLLRELKPSSSCGLDGLTARILKAAGPSIVPPLCHIINRSIESACMPSSLKIGCSTPLFKEGNASDPCNYRPVSVFPVVGKVIEWVAHTQLYSFYRDRNFFSDS